MAAKTVIDLKDMYKNVVMKKLQEKFNYKNVHQIPRIEKIVINRGVGETISNSKAIQSTIEEFELLFGQKPIVLTAKKSIAGFKLREGMKIGCKVPLRSDKMYLFLNKLVNVILPKIRDFRGVSNKAFDKEGNYTLGIREQLIFPEINFDKVDKARGFNISFVTNTKSIEESSELLRLLGMPFRRN